MTLQVTPEVWVPVGTGWHVSLEQMLEQQVPVWEQRAAVKALRAQGNPRLSEALVFMAIERQRAIVERARRETRHARADSAKARPRQRPATRTPPPPAPGMAVDYSKTVDPFPVEMW